MKEDTALVHDPLDDADPWSEEYENAVAFRTRRLTSVGLVVTATLVIMVALVVVVLAAGYLGLGPWPLW